MAQEKSSASAHRPTPESRRCEVCGASSHEKTLVGLRNDRSKDGPRFCLPHHPDSLAGSVQANAFVGAL
jgi:hypothetical protein